MPRGDGREVLAVVKADADLRRIPVVVLTTSQAEEDILRTYDLHATAYVSKPVDFDDFLEVIRSIDNFSFSFVTLPRDCGPEPAQPSPGSGPGTGTGSGRGPDR